MSNLVKLVFNKVPRIDEDHIAHLFRSGTIDVRDMSAIADTILRPTFRQVCTYLVAMNDRNPNRNKDLDPRDAYNNAAEDIVNTLGKIVKVFREMQKRDQ